MGDFIYLHEESLTPISASLTSNFYYGSLKRAEPRLTDTENEFMVTKGEMCGRGREKIRSVG